MRKKKARKEILNFGRETACITAAVKIIKATSNLFLNDGLLFSLILRC
ncbi:MAG: hypothetical protein MUF15_09825 [Acidobacteria bacterium]|nr:hypothetical protein [Acidobacteriota bacterium]